MRRRVPSAYDTNEAAVADLAKELSRLEVEFEGLTDGRPGVRIVSERWNGRLVIVWVPNADSGGRGMFQGFVRPLDEDDFKPAWWERGGYNAWCYVNEFTGLVEDDERSPGDNCALCRQEIPELAHTCPEAEDGRHSPHPGLCPWCKELVIKDYNARTSTVKEYYDPRNSYGLRVQVHCENCEKPVTRNDSYGAPDRAWKKAAN
ncbi:hypothetical protein ABZ543_13325 [Streptomyces roseifaciens]